MEAKKFEFNVLYVLVKIINFSSYACRKICDSIENRVISETALKNLRTEKCKDLIQSEILLFLGEYVNKHLKAHGTYSEEWIKSLSVAWLEILHRYRHEITEEEMNEIFVLRLASYLYQLRPLSRQDS